MSRGGPPLSAPKYRTTGADRPTPRGRRVSAGPCGGRRAAAHAAKAARSAARSATRSARRRPAATRDRRPAAFGRRPTWAANLKTATTDARGHPTAGAAGAMLAALATCIGRARARRTNAHASAAGARSAPNWAAPGSVGTIRTHARHSIHVFPLETRPHNSDRSSEPCDPTPSAAPEPRAHAAFGLTPEPNSSLSVYGRTGRAALWGGRKKSGILRDFGRRTACARSGRRRRRA